MGLRAYTQLSAPGESGLAMPCRSRSSSFLSLPGFPLRRPVGTLGKHPMKYQIPCDELPLEVSIWGKMSILCQVISYHFCRWAFTDVLPTSFIFCGSASPCSGWRSKEVCPLPHEQPLTWSGGCAGGEWHTCVVSSTAGGRGSEGHGGRRVHDPQPPARLNARGN